MIQPFLFFLRDHLQRLVGLQLGKGQDQRAAADGDIERRAGDPGEGGIPEHLVRAVIQAVEREYENLILLL